MEALKPILSEVLRPSTLDDIVLPENVLQALKSMVSQRSLMNMVFFGAPGVGKTTAVRILLKELDVDVYEINGSFNNGDKSMVRGIENFSSAMSLRGNFRVCFIDEADHMSRATQDALRYIIEKLSGNTRFIMTANHIDKLTEAIRSRCIPVCFNQKPIEAMTLVERLTDRYQTKMEKLGFHLEHSRIRQIVGLAYPDMRAIANKLEFEALQATN